jgi:hypothetical protein
MAPRANWKGFLRLSLVTCPVALYPATSESEKISFNQLNRQTGHRVKYLKVDADTGDEVPNEDIVKGYQLEKDQFSGAAAETKAPKRPAKNANKATPGQKELLMPIAGKKPAKEAAKKPAAGRQRKSA